MPPFPPSNASPPGEPGPRLARDLADLYGASPGVPASVDARLRRRIRRHFSTAGARTGRLTGWRAGAAAAAVIVLTAAGVFLHGLGVTGGRGPAPAPGSTVAAGDVDHNGVVDILDAFALARLIEAGQIGARAPGLDVNGDGRVDRGDVDTIAMTAVRLGGERS